MPAADDSRAAMAPTSVIDNRHCFECDLTTPCALVLLNTPVASPPALRRAWCAGHSLRVAADGAANRLREAPGCGALVPDLVCGDWDSIAPATEAHFLALGVEMAPSPEDQESTDLVKCLRRVEAWQRASGFGGSAPRCEGVGETSVVVGAETGGPGFLRRDGGGGAGGSFDGAAAAPSQPQVRVVVFGAFGGRFDQEMQNLNALFEWRARFAQLTLVGDDCLACLLPAGRSLVRVAAPHEGPTCGLIPLGAPLERLSTRGLHWDVADWASAFGGQISTSNRVRDGGRDVEVEASGDLVWTASLAAVAEAGE